MRIFKRILAVLVILMISVICFFTWNLITSLISNYQSLSKVALSGIPMILFFAVIIVTLFAMFNYRVLRRQDAFMARKFSIIIGSIALVGVIFSILCGTYVYGSFFKDYIFTAYPFIMLLCHSITLLACIYIAYISIKYIVKNKPVKTWKNPKLYWLRELFIAEILIFALERLGAFVLMPMYFSGYDSIYVLPVYIELLVPALIFVTFLIHEHWLHNRKVTMILSSVALGYSVASLIYLLIIAKGTYPLVVNPLSPIMQLERLILKPIGTIALYGFSILLSGLNLLNNVIMIVKEKRKPTVLN